MSDGLSQVSVTPTMSRSFDETKSPKADVLLGNDRAFNRQALKFLTDGKNQDDGPPRVDTVGHMTTICLQGDKSNDASLRRG